MAKNGLFKNDTIKVASETIRMNWICYLFNR